jgi:threonine dehydrogenase-like Zn-dependent dehydrogenase
MGVRGTGLVGDVPTRDTYDGTDSVQSAATPTAASFWIARPGVGELRDEALRPPGEDEVLVRTRWTGISRGTESIVFRGEVPPSEWERMRAPAQEGDFPAPVKYGYLNVGEVVDGPATLRGTTVFALRPHQSSYIAPAASVIPVPRGVPARRAVLAGCVETAVNILWDAAPAVGDRIAVVGAGMVGAAVARLARGIPGAAVTLVDTDLGKAATADALGVDFAVPGGLPRHDIVIEASGSEAGMRVALDLAADDGEVVVASWFGMREVALPLGADFHSRRLTLRASQVGAVALHRRASRTPADRLALALRLLEDPAFDALITDASGWRELPRVMAAIAAGEAPGLCHIIDWRDAP